MALGLLLKTGALFLLVSENISAGEQSPERGRQSTLAAVARTPALLARRDFQAGFGAVECVEGSLDIDRRVTAGQSLLGALLGLARAFHVDLGWTLGRLGEDGDFVGKNFGESPCDRELLLGGVLPICDLAYGEFGDQRRVSGENAE